MTDIAAGSAIVPRWEWRTFGERFETADRYLDAQTADRLQESDEVYLLSVNADASVKLRDDLLDVKHLEQVNDDGLELWKPVMKSPFPLAPAEVISVLTALNVAVPALDRTEYTPSDFKADVIDANADLRATRVHKRRAHYNVDDCMVERTELTVDNRTALTIAIESPDPKLVLATRGRLGLDGLRNVNVARGLKSLIGFGAQRYAVIDVGTNSVKFHIGERRADGTWHVVIDRADITRLGEGLEESGRLAEPAIERTADAIVAMVEEARRAGVVAIAAVGTAGLRIAPNRAALTDAVQERCGVTVEVISGEDEGRLAYLAATTALSVGRGALVVFDSGGGSSQFTFGHGEHVDERFSVDVGAVRFAERFALTGVVSQDVLDTALDAIAADLDRLDGRTRPDAVIAMGGTATNLAAVKHALASYDPEVVQGTVLDLAEIDRQIELYRTHDTEARRQIVGLQPQRAEVILAGACIVRTILTKLGNDSLTVSDRGLRHGLLVERFSL